NTLVFTGGGLHTSNFCGAESLKILQFFPVFFQGVAGDEESQNFFFVGKPGVLVPIGDFGKLIVLMMSFLLVKYPEQAVLAGFRITLGFLRALNGLVENPHELGTTAKSIHSAALDQRLQYTLV